MSVVEYDQFVLLSVYVDYKGYYLPVLLLLQVMVTVDRYPPPECRWYHRGETRTSVNFDLNC